MDARDFLGQIGNINVCTNGDKRSPHKPLLLFIAFQRVQAQKARLLSFNKIEDQLVSLLESFGPDSAKKTPHLPFWHLQSDQIWEIPNKKGILTDSGSVSRKFLREQKVQAGFTQTVFELLQKQEDLIEKSVSLLLEMHFPLSWHQEIMDAIGFDFEVMPLDQETFKRPKRDSLFRKRVLEAYDYRCAICDFSVRMENTPVALEAAHIKWFRAGGPNIESNGLALCSLHHRLFDRGVMAISEQQTILVSEKANGHAGFKEWVLDFEGKPIRTPRRKDYVPANAFTKWHVREIFLSRYKSISD